MSTDVVLRITLGDLLIEKEYRVFCVDNFESVCEYVKNETIDLVLLDTRLEDIDEEQTLANIRNSKVPIVFINGQIHDDILEKIFNLDISGYIMKPFEINKIFNKVNIALGY
jgi:two-component system response regulator AtoC